METTVHPTAVVDEGASVGAGTRIWHFCHVMGSARIGARCILSQNVMIGAHVTIGDGCKLQNNVSVYEGVTLQDGVFCGPSMVFTNVSRPRAFIERKSSFADTLVRTGATIGANATIICGHTIGQYAVVGAGAVVTHDVPDHALVIGTPARRVGWVCRCGAAAHFSAVAQQLRCADCGTTLVKEGEKVQVEPGLHRS